MKREYGLKWSAVFPPSKASPSLYTWLVLTARRRFTVTADSAIPALRVTIL